MRRRTFLASVISATGGVLLPGARRFARAVETLQYRGTIYATPSRGDIVMAGDLTRLRTQVNDVRARYGLAAFQWTDPVTRNFLQMIGRAEGQDIVQLGTRPDGQLARWSFADITADSFLWRGEVSADAGATWRVVTEFTARRREA